MLLWSRDVVEMMDLELWIIHCREMAIVLKMLNCENIIVEMNYDLWGYHGVEMLALVDMLEGVRWWRQKNSCL